VSKVPSINYFIIPILLFVQIKVLRTAPLHRHTLRYRQLQIHLLRRDRTHLQRRSRLSPHQAGALPLQYLATDSMHPRRQFTAHP
jgi:hypothetical protein